MSDYTLALVLLGSTTLVAIFGLLTFARMAFHHIAGEREVMQENALQSLTYLKANTPMEAVEAEAMREREAAALTVETAAAEQALERQPVKQTNATGIAYARNSRTGEEFDIVAGAGV